MITKLDNRTVLISPDIVITVQNFSILYNAHGKELMIDTEPIVIGRTKKFLFLSKNIYGMMVYLNPMQCQLLELPLPKLIDNIKNALKILSIEFKLKVNDTDIYQSFN